MLKRIKIHGAFIALLIWSATTVNAQSDLSLKAFIQRGLESQYGLKIVEEDLEIAMRNNTLGNAGFFPVVTLNANRDYSVQNTRQTFLSGDENNVDAARSNGLNISADADWRIFDGLQMFARKNQLELMSDMTAEDVRFYVEQSISDMVLLYYQYKREVQRLELLKNNAIISEERLELELQKDKLGKSNRLEIERARSDLNRDLIQVSQQEANIKALAFQINRLMINPLDTEWNLTDSITVAPLLNNREDVIAKMTVENTQLEQSKMMELWGEQQVRIDRGSYMPTVDLFGSYTYGRSESEAGFLRSNQSLGPSYGIRVQFNLFDGGRRNIALNNAKSQFEKYQYQTNELEWALKEQVYTAWEQYAATMAQIELQRASVKNLNEVFTIAEAQYHLGKINYLDYRTIQLDYLTAKSSLLDLEYRFIEYETVLLRLSGQIEAYYIAD